MLKKGSWFSPLNTPSYFLAGVRLRLWLSSSTGCMTRAFHLCLCTPCLSCIIQLGQQVAITAAAVSMALSIFLSKILIDRS